MVYKFRPATVVAVKKENIIKVNNPTYNHLAIHNSMTMGEESHLYRVRLEKQCQNLDAAFTRMDVFH
jgi:hypothetical protein